MNELHIIDILYEARQEQISKKVSPSQEIVKKYFDEIIFHKNSMFDLLNSTENFEDGIKSEILEHQEEIEQNINFIVGLNNELHYKQGFSDAINLLNTNTF